MNDTGCLSLEDGEPICGWGNERFYKNAVAFAPCIGESVGFVSTGTARKGEQGGINDQRREIAEQV